MTKMLGADVSRRVFLRSAMVVAGGLTVPASLAKTTGAVVDLPAARDVKPMEVIQASRVAEVRKLGEAARAVRPELFRNAMAALQAHGSRVRHRDRIAIADFSRASGKPRFHLVNLEDGDTQTLLVAHGSGSDPAHSGYLTRFSNQPNSNATSEGAFVTSDYYVGKHGKSQRLVGLDATNNNALDRAIVIHGAWYANADMLAKHGKLGRSQGCFAVGEGELAKVFARLGEGRMIYAAKV
jgi:hypothetical protein